MYSGYDNLNATANCQYIPELKKLGDKYIDLFKLGKGPKKTTESTQDPMKMGEFNTKDTMFQSKRSTWYNDGEEMMFATTAGKSAPSFAFKSPSKSDVSFDLESVRDNPYSSSIISLQQMT